MKDKFKPGDVLYRNKAPDHYPFYICIYSEKYLGRDSPILNISDRHKVLMPGYGPENYTVLFNIHKMTKKQSKILKIFQGGNEDSINFALDILKQNEAK